MKLSNGYIQYFALIVDLGIIIQSYFLDGFKSINELLMFLLSKGLIKAENEVEWNITLILNN